jgi:hypothetical protein
MLTPPDSNRLPHRPRARHGCGRSDYGYARDGLRYTDCRSHRSSARGGLRALPLMEAIVVRASDRHRQLLSYLHSATILARLLTRSNETELAFRFGRAYRVIK